MSYVVSSGAYGHHRQEFAEFRAALRAYRLKRAYMLTLPKNAWFVVTLVNEERVDEGDDTGLTEDELCAVYDDSYPRWLLNERVALAYHGNVCGHAVANAGERVDGCVSLTCAVCGHEWREFSGEAA